MDRSTLVFRILAIAALTQLLATGTANAYIDPGSGSFFVQMLLAGLLGAGMAIKAYWGRIRAFFSSSKSASAAEEEPRDQ